MNPRSLLAPRTLCAVTFLSAATTAWCQSAAADPAGEVNHLEPVIVTGTYLAVPAGAAATPVTEIGAQDIADSGVSTDVLGILRKTLPQFAGNANLGLENAGSQAFFTMGGSAVSIHNLTTLVLVNGRRVAFDPAQAAVGGEFVDVNMIPPSAIDHVEVLSNGGSALYGSDAIGGVVNIILKHGFNGWDAGVHWGSSTGSGRYTERSGYLSGGVDNGTTSLMISVEGVSTSPIYSSQRAYAHPVFATTNYPGLIDVVDFQAGTDTFYQLAPGNSAPPGGGQTIIDQLVQSGVYTPVTPQQAVAGYDASSHQTLQESLERRSLVADFEHKLAGDRLVFFGDLMLGHTRTMSSVDGQGITAYVSTPTSDFAEYGTTPPPPGPYAFLPYVPASAAANPFNSDWLQGFLVTAHTRSTTPIVTDVASDFVRTADGFRGKLGDSWSWEAAVNYSRYHAGYSSPGQVDTAALNAALASGAFNPFALPDASTLPADVFGTKTDDMFSSLLSYDAIVRGSPLDLPGGKLELAFGGTFVREHLTAQPDANSLPGPDSIPAWLSYQSLNAFDAGRDVASLFGEVKVPLVGPAQNVPGLHSLTLDLSGRYDHYTVVGHSAVPEVAVTWQPFDDQLLFRASAGRSFSAPTLYNLFGPIQAGQIPPITFQNYGGGYTPQAVFNGFGGSNPDLQPSTAHNVSAGVVFAPRGLPGFDVTADYFASFQKGVIGFLSTAAIVQSTELLGPASPFAQYVHLGSPAGPGVTAPGQLSTAQPSSVYINVPLINLAAQAVKGFDVRLDYGPKPTAAGRFFFTSAITVFNSYLVQALPTEGYYNYAGYASGQVSSSQGTIPHFRLYSTAEWSRGAYDATVGYTFVGSVTDIGPGGDAASAPTPVGSYSQVDVILGLDLAKLTKFAGSLRPKLRVGVDNIFNRQPPVAPGAFPFTNADLGTYGGAIGRMIFVDATCSF